MQIKHTNMCCICHTLQQSPPQCNKTPSMLTLRQFCTYDAASLN